LTPVIGKIDSEERINQTSRISSLGKTTSKKLLPDISNGSVPLP
jgi:hypothetical protein